MTLLQIALIFPIAFLIAAAAARAHFGVLPLLLALLTAVSLFVLFQSR